MLLGLLLAVGLTVATSADDGLHFVGGDGVCSLSIQDGPALRSNCSVITQGASTSQTTSDVDPRLWYADETLVSYLRMDELETRASVMEELALQTMGSGRAMRTYSRAARAFVAQGRGDSTPTRA